MSEFSKLTSKLRASEIRELMKLAADPSIISFAGGMPNNSLFPTDTIQKLFTELPQNVKEAAFQYSPTTGYPPLLDSLKNYLEQKGLSIDGNSLLITTGAQQALNIVAKLFIDEGDIVLCEYPSFIGAVAAFRSFGANLRGIELDSEGIAIKPLRKFLDKNYDKVKFLYLTPYFHNPAGITYSQTRKNEIIEVIREFNITLLEDDPYSELYFSDEDQPLMRSIKSIMNDSNNICYVGSFAKILGPGMRLGYLYAPDNIIEKGELAKQSMDACTSSFNQVIADAYLRQDKLRPYLNFLRPIYKKRAEMALLALEKYMPEGVEWTTPKGGFYIWVTLPNDIDSSDVFSLAVEKGAAFVVGKAFDPEGKKNNSFRIAFSHTPESNIEDGIKIIADAVTAVFSK